MNCLTITAICWKRRVTQRQTGEAGKVLFAELTHAKCRRGIRQQAMIGAETGIECAVERLANATSFRMTTEKYRQK
jgi:hypothetical protein